MITPATSDSIVANAIHVPTQSFSAPTSPCPEIVITLEIVAIESAITPASANLRARVEDVNAARSMKVTGLTNHQGIDPTPPPFAKNARFGPPPAKVNPGSSRRREGWRKDSKDAGRRRAIGARTNVTRRSALAKKSWRSPVLRNWRCETTILSKDAQAIRANAGGEKLASSAISRDARMMNCQF
ncbi:unannotated protein [freshwater metagenome]|uniref:Unannotated protein n=1 Tax=freshwater metagenome TaxID=449393 RepID=A0A6J6TED5_9ZZZZ